MWYILDENDEPVAVDYRRFNDWLEQLPEKGRTGCGFTLAFNELGDIQVSTVFLGVDHSHEGNVPVLWETMVFGGEDDQHGWRYTSRQDAIIGHKKICDLYLRGKRGFS